MSYWDEIRALAKRKGVSIKEARSRWTEKTQTEAALRRHSVIPLNSPVAGVGAQWYVDPDDGLLAGVMALDDVVIPMAPVPLPPQIKWLRVAVEVTAFSEDTTVAIRLRVLNRKKGVLEDYETPDFKARLGGMGERVQFLVLPEQYEPGNLFTCSVCIALLTDDDEGERDKVLMRGAWLEVR